MSQSFQVAPFDDYYQFKNRTSDQDVPSNDVYVENLVRNNEEANFRPDRPSETAWNPYLGGPLQQAVSGLTSVPADVYYEHDSPRWNTYGTSCTSCPRPSTDHEQVSSCLLMLMTARMAATSLGWPTARSPGLCGPQLFGRTMRPRLVSASFQRSP